MSHVRTEDPSTHDSGGSRVSTPRRRLRWLLPIDLLLVWLVVAGISGPYNGKLAEVQQNDTAAFLPADAESTKVAELNAGFSDNQAFPVFLLVESGTRHTAGQLAAVQRFAAGIPDVEVPVAGGATSAWVVLAATFSALGVLPILFLAQIALIVAFGVLLDRLVVRSLLVPALSYDIGRRIWWPFQLWREPEQPRDPDARPDVAPEPEPASRC